MHPDTDEFLHVLEGSVSVELFATTATRSCRSKPVS
jgi:hypothetical protein